LSAPTVLLRPAIEAVMQVAREGEAAEPTQPAPAQLKRYLRFAKLPAPALDIARRVVEEDDDFRRRVAARLKEEDVGEAGWLWLTRPDGWEARLDELGKHQQEQEHAEHEERAEREAHRRLAGAEDRARRAEVALTARTQEIAQLRDELARERAARQQAETAVRQIVDNTEELTAQRNAAVRHLKEVEAELAQRSADLRHARHEIRMREAEVENLKNVPAPAPPAAAVTPPPPSAPSTDAGVDREQLARLIGDASRGAEALSSALAAASELLAPPRQAPVPPQPPASRPRPPTPPVSPVRSPLRLPPGVMDDTPEAVDHLVRAPGALLLVDGYNISNAAWYQDPIARQRTRLVDALAELHSRTGVEIEVVFDGADVDRFGERPPRPAVRVRFSDAGVEADDVLLELVDAAPSRRPVIVASSDHRVRDGSRRRGANVVGARQLLGALRR
jgi:predicted RNA-binding protein with PIN domain